MDLLLVHWMAVRLLKCFPGERLMLSGKSIILE